MTRVGHQKRSTNEIDIDLKIDIDGKGDYQLLITSVDIEEPSSMFYFNHFLHQVASWGIQDIGGHVNVKDNSSHHGWEDTSIVLGRTYKEAFGDKKGITRAANFVLPFEGNRAEVAIDLSGRGYSDLKTEVRDPHLEEMINHVFLSLTREGGIDFYGRTYGRDDHHQIEALGKAFGRAVFYATRLIEQYAERIPSTKGILE